MDFLLLRVFAQKEWNIKNSKNLLCRMQSNDICKGEMALLLKKLIYFLGRRNIQLKFVIKTTVY